MKLKIGIHRRLSNDNLREAIQASGMKYPEIKKKTRIDLKYLSMIVNFRKNPTEKEKILLSVALGVPIDNIFPEKYDELYDRISPIKREAQLEVDLLSLDSPEVLLLESPDGVESMERQTENNMFAKRLEELKQSLTPREQFIIRRIYVEDAKHEEVGKELMVTRERVRQIEAKALDKMRQKMHEDNLRPDTLRDLLPDRYFE